MRKIYTSLLALAMTMVSMVANAQYKAEFTTDPVESWTAGYVNLDPVELATALATDTATLHAAFNAISKENAESFFYLKTADGKTNAYTGNAGEFWMNMETMTEDQYAKKNYKNGEYICTIVFHS